MIANATRRISLLGLLIVLVACAPMVAPRGLETDRPTLLADAFLTRDGLRLPLRRWEAKNPRAIIVALHGMGDYSNAFDMPATWWANNGITTLAYDQRGFGAAPNRGLWPGADALRGDLGDFVEAVRDRYQGLPIYALGESMGGAVLLTALASPALPRLDGVILVAPAVWSRTDMPVSYRVALWLGAHTVPAMTVSGRGLHIWPSDNIPMLRKLARDPLFEHVTRTDAVYGLVDLMDEARHAPDHLGSSPPILFLYGRNDQIIPEKPTRATIGALGSHANVQRYEHGYHMLLRDLDGPLVWQDVARWIQSGTSSRLQAAQK